MMMTVDEVSVNMEGLRQSVEVRDQSKESSKHSAILCHHVSKVKTVGQSMDRLA